MRGNCEETGLGWIGKPIDSKKDIFFTNWIEFFLQPECVDRIEVHNHIEEDSSKRIIENLTTTNLERQNPVLTTDQSEELICNVGKPFQSTLVVYSRGNHPWNGCFEITQKISPVAHSTHSISPFRITSGTRKNQSQLTQKMDQG